MYLSASPPHSWAQHTIQSRLCVSPFLLVTYFRCVPKIPSLPFRWRGNVSDVFAVGSDGHGGFYMCLYRFFTYDQGIDALCFVRGAGVGVGDTVCLTYCACVRVYTCVRVGVSMCDTCLYRVLARIECVNVTRESACLGARMRGHGFYIVSDCVYM